jgi:hypothetical protein
MYYYYYLIIGGVLLGVLASSAVDRGFEPRSGQAKNYDVGICCFSGKHAVLRRKSKDWLARGIFQLYHSENKLCFNEIMMMSALY